MKTLAALLLAPLCAAPAFAAGLGPSTQTLEAMHGSAIANPNNFFDGLDARVSALQPVEYAPLPLAPQTKPVEPIDTGFDSHVIAPGLTVHHPVPPQDVRPTSGSEGISGMTIVLIVAAAVVGVALLLLLLL